MITNSVYPSSDVPISTFTDNLFGFTNQLQSKGLRTTQVRISMERLIRKAQMANDDWELYYLCAYAFGITLAIPCYIAGSLCTARLVGDHLYSRYFLTRPRKDGGVLMLIILTSILAAVVWPLALPIYYLHYFTTEGQTFFGWSWDKFDTDSERLVQPLHDLQSQPIQTYFPVVNSEHEDDGLDDFKPPKYQRRVQ
jgi:hypothetical protein